MCTRSAEVTAISTSACRSLVVAALDGGQEIFHVRAGIVAGRFGLVDRFFLLLSLAVLDAFVNLEAALSTAIQPSLP